MLDGGGGAAWSHKNVAPPPVWKPKLAPCLAFDLEPQQKRRLGGLHLEPLAERRRSPPKQALTAINMRGWYNDIPTNGASE